MSKPHIKVHLLVEPQDLDRFGNVKSVAGGTHKGIVGTAVCNRLAKGSFVGHREANVNRLTCKHCRLYYIKYVGA